MLNCTARRILEPRANFLLAHFCPETCIQYIITTQPALTTEAFRVRRRGRGGGLQSCDVAELPVAIDKRQKGEVSVSYSNNMGFEQILPFLLMNNDNQGIEQILPLLLMNNNNQGIEGILPLLLLMNQRPTSVSSECIPEEPVPVPTDFNAYLASMVGDVVRVSFADAVDNAITMVGTLSEVGTDYIILRDVTAGDIYLGVRERAAIPISNLVGIDRIPFFQRILPFLLQGGNMGM